MDFNHIIFWVIFSAIVAVMLYIDLYATDHRKGKLSFKRSIMWTGVWISVALIFDLMIYMFLEDGHNKAIQFLSSYIVEKSLSVDNLFVFIMIFNVMKIPEENQPHILKWGILSAVVLRIVFILAGVALIHYFHPIIYLFGILLLYAAYKMAFTESKPMDVENNKIIKFLKNRFNLLPDFKGSHFFVRNNKGLFITPAFLTLVLIEASDVMFAVDSIPAVLAITTDPFIAITSNIFAILGLRALYFALAGILDMFTYLKYGVSMILAFVGVKMILSDYYPIPTQISLLVILSLLTLSIVWSLMKRKPTKENEVQ
jgi:tellurite resistance protein TerC